MNRRKSLFHAGTFVLVWGIAVSTAQAAGVVRMHTGDFDPLVTAPQAQLAPSTLSSRSAADVEDGEAIYIVQFHKSPMPADQAALTALGVRIHAPIQDHALIVKMTGAASRQAAALPSVRWVGPFLVDYRLEPALLESLTQDATARATAATDVTRYTILLFERNQAAKDAVTQAINTLGGEVHLVSGGRLIEASMTVDALRAIAGLNEVQFVERWTPAENDMDMVREVNGANFVETVAGYTGQGVRGEVFDDGIRAAHRDFQANPPIFHPSNSSDNDHGTNTYGIVFGDGTANPNGRGMLPDAEQPIFSTRNRSFNRFNHTAQLVDPNGQFRAVFQSNSWGNSRTRSYTAVSADMDDIIFAHDFLITQSQSNAGNRDSRPQAWAKNIVSVGGIRGFNTPNRGDDRWNGSASIGPASDGRIKPDLSQFYDNVFSTNETGNSAYASFGGTSAATPIVAGHFGLMYQMWADGVFDGGPGKGRDVFDSRPHASTAKALMINTAFQYTFSGTGHDRTRTHQGWGFPDLQILYDAAERNGWRLPILIDETAVLAPGQTHRYQLSSNGSEPIKATMVYLDPAGLPNSSVHRVNDLTLKVTSPGGTVYWGNAGLRAGNWSAPGGSANTVDTVENVFVQNPEAGAWTIEIIGNEIVQDSHTETAAIDADYALVVTGGTAGTPPPVPSVTIAATDPTATEAGPTTGTIQISRTGATGAALTVRFNVSGSATPGTDYAVLGTSVVIPAGQSNATVVVDPVDDTDVEPNETVDVTLAANAAYRIGGPSTARVTIESDDTVGTGPTVTISAVRDTANEAGIVRGRFRIDRVGDRTAALTVRYAVAGDATPGDDYRALPGTKTIKAGKGRAFFDVIPVNDTAVEDPETVDVTLSADPAYQVGAANSGTVTIQSDDVVGSGPVVSLTVLRDTAREANTVRGRFRLNRTGNLSAPLTVRYSVAGSATSGADYRALSGTKTINAGKNRAWFDIVPVNDGDVEGLETVEVTVSPDPAYQLNGSALGTVTIVSDE